MQFGQQVLLCPRILQSEHCGEFRVSFPPRISRPNPHEGWEMGKP